MVKGIQISGIDPHPPHGGAAPRYVLGFASARPVCVTWRIPGRRTTMNLTTTQDPRPKPEGD